MLRLIGVINFLTTMMAMLSGKTILLATLCMGVFARAVEPLPRWEIVELGLPANQPSQAVDLNERTELLGRMGPAGAEIGFVWREHQLRFLNAVGTRAFPRDINNFGVVVGSFASNSVMRAWAWSNGVNLNLSLGTLATVATAINDHGEIIGAQEVSVYPYIYRLSQPTARLCPDVLLPISTSLLDRYRGGGAFALNNNGVVVGQFISNGFVSTNWAEKSWPRGLEAPAAPDVWAESAALAVNSLDQIAGWVRTRTRYAEAAVWRTNHWVALPSSLEWSASVESINDSGWMVGTMQSGPTAMIWKDDAGADLNSFVDLPAESRLTNAVAINNAGYIAATLLQGEMSRAVLLKPVREGKIPKLEIVGPNDVVLHTNKVIVTVETPYVGPSGRTVTYRLYDRVQTMGYDRYTNMKEYRTEQVRMTTTSGETVSAWFEDLRPAHYLLGAELSDTDGVTLYAAPIEFVVSERPQLTPYRVNWSDQFQFTMQPTPGQEYVLEESADLVTWTRVDVLRASGGGFQQPATNSAMRFYRTALASEGTVIDSRAEGTMQEAPAAIPARGARIYLTDLTDITLSRDGRFVANTRQEPRLGWGTYDYRPHRYGASLTLLRDDNPAIRADFEIEFPLILPTYEGLSYRPKVRGTITGPDQSVETSGVFYID
jgi:uncharacterized membrane protein